MRLPFNIQPKRTDLQERALVRAKEIYNSNPKQYEDTMFCPYCGSSLIKSGEQRRMETLSEHVCNPNGTPSLKDEYICSAEGMYQYLSEGKDKQLGCKFGILHSWNGGFGKGGSYTSKFWRKLYDLSEKSVINKEVVDSWFHEDYSHKHKAALNTFECEAQTSIYNEGLRRNIPLPAWLTLNLIRLKLDFHYTANSFGEVTSTSVTLGFLKKDERNEFCRIGNWFWNTWLFLNRDTKRNLKLAKECKDEKSKAKAVAEAMNICRNDALIYRLHQAYEYLIHPRYARLLKKYGYYKVPTWNIWNID